MKSDLLFQKRPRGGETGFPVGTSREVSANAATPPVGRGILRGVFRLIASWRERERLRRDLSVMRPGDFGDLAVPPSLVVDEIRKWPWQKVSPQWGENRPAGSHRSSDNT
jgi:uncharacterized protein YjiS (DUF1127 family)